MNAARKTKKTFGSPEKESIVKTIVLWGVIAIGLSGIIAMIVTNPSQKRLNCSSTPTTSLIGFGSCVEE